MDTDEARAILTQHLASYRALSYEALVTRVHTIETADIQAPSGVQYQLEVQFLWDAKPKENVRVIGSVDDGGWRAFVPVTDAFIRGSDGRLVGE